MKKILSAILAGTMMCSMAIGFAGCGGSGEASKTETTAPAETKAVSTADSATKDSANKGENGELHMATNAFFEPYEYYENDKIVGIDAEIAEAICDKLGYTLVIDDMDFDSIITAVQSGKADFGMAGMTVTEERKQAIDFTDTYTNAVQVIIVKEGSDKVKTKDDLKTAVIGVQMGTTGDIYVSDYEADGATIERFNKGADAVLALAQGKVDAVVIDNEPAKAFVAQNEGLVILDEPFENEEYAICVAKGSELTEKINGALAALKEEGKVDEIINKYIKA
ncbi:MAG: basic amino acid ABC transporter substrate-binding protein [Ruminococcus sp.]|nr:basic amino acid ABC transporter substrate-binding protein [Ruminococcus sp.]